MLSLAEMTPRRADNGSASPVRERLPTCGPATQIWQSKGRGYLVATLAVLRHDKGSSGEPNGEPMVGAARQL